MINFNGELVACENIKSIIENRGFKYGDSFLKP